MNAEQLKELLENYRTENQNLDYKETIAWDGESNARKAELVKDILAFSNTKDGGLIVIGVTNAEFSPIGVSEEVFTTIDTTKVNDFLHRFTDPLHACAVEKILVERKRFIVISVPEFQEVPIICKADCEPLRKGNLHYRTEKATSEPIKTAEHVRELLGRGLMRKRGELLGAIDTIMKGRPTHSTPTAMELCRNEQQVVEKWLEENQESTRLKNGHWTFIVHPSEYIKPFDRHEALLAALKAASVTTHGCHFPFIRPDDNVSNRNNGISAETNTGGHGEWFGALFSGLVIWKGIPQEDLRIRHEDGPQVIDYERVIFLFRLFMLFMERFYSALNISCAVNYRIILNGSKGRRLISSDQEPYLVPQIQKHMALEDPIVIEETVELPELQAATDQLIADAAQRFYALFNCTLIERNDILAHLQKLRSE